MKERLIYTTLLVLCVNIFSFHMKDLFSHLFSHYSIDILYTFITMSFVAPTDSQQLCWDLNHMVMECESQVVLRLFGRRLRLAACLISLRHFAGSRFLIIPKSLTANLKIDKHRPGSLKVFKFQVILSGKKNHDMCETFTAAYSSK